MGKVATFADATRRLALGVSLARWTGTPFLQGAAQVGVGIDCVRFVREVYRDCGIDVGPAEEIPRYNLAYGIHSEHSALLGWLLGNDAARARLARLDEDAEPMPGDIAVVRMHKAAHHIGVVAPDVRRIAHVDLCGGVTQVDVEQLRRHARSITLFRHFTP